MKLARQATFGVAWSLVERLGAHLLQFIVFVVLARLLAPADFGLLAMAAVFIAIGQVLVEQGFSDALVQKGELTASHLDTAFWTTVTIGLVLCATLYISANLVSRIYSQPELTSILQLLASVLVLDSLGSVPRALIRRRLDFASLAIRSLIAAVAGGSVGLLFAFNGYGVYSLVAQAITHSAIGVAVLWSLANWRPGLNCSLQSLKELFSFGINVTCIAILGVTTRHVDKFLIGVFIGPVALGYYFVAYNLVDTAIRSLSGIIGNVAFPLFSRLQVDANRSRMAFIYSVQASSLIAFPAFLGLAAVGPEFVPAVFGTEWERSVPVVQILALLGLTYPVSVLHNSIIKASGRPQWVLVLAVISAVVSAVAILLAIPWGIVAIASAYVLRSYLLFPVTLVLVAHLVKVGLRTYFNQFLEVGVATIAMLSAILVTRHLTPESITLHARLGLLIASGISAYTGAIWYLRPLVLKRGLLILRGE